MMAPIKQGLVFIIAADSEASDNGINGISSHRSKVGSISAAEAVKSLQQPVLVKTEPPASSETTEPSEPGLSLPTNKGENTTN